jgi:hypothetical protein
MDFSGNHTAPTAELTGDEDRPASSQLLAVDFGNLPGHFDLTARRFRPLGPFAVVGCRERHQQQRYRLAVTPPVALGVGGEDSAEVQAIEPALGVLAWRGTRRPCLQRRVPTQRVGGRARPLPHSGASGGSVG